MQLFLLFSCIVWENRLSLHRVFHSIRFKVNKGWTTAVVLFYCLLYLNLCFPPLQIKVL